MYFLASIVICDDHIIEKDFGGHDKRTTITKCLPGKGDLLVHLDNAILCVVVMCRESSRSDLVKEFHEKSHMLVRTTSFDIHS